MKSIDDERWRLAARALDVELVGPQGHVVPADQATQADRMRGRVRGRRVRVRHGLQDAADRTTVIDVTLRRPLLLGLEAHAYLDPAPQSRRFARRGVFSSVKSIE